MQIVHLLSQNHLTGAEVYAASLAQNQLQNSHRVYQISNGFFHPTEALKITVEVENKSKMQQLKNIFWLRNFIKKENIQVVHSHSRAAVKLAYWATLFTRTAHVSTVHGVQHSSISKKIHNQYGQFILCVCENVKKHLQQDFSYNEQRLKVLANPIDTKIFKFVPVRTSEDEKKTFKIAIVGRATGPKGDRTRQVLAELQSPVFQKYSFEIKLIGNESGTFTPLNSEVYSQYDLIIGSGRVCMEALITGVPVIAFGEACYEGLIDAGNFKSAQSSNFGDIHPDSKEPRINSPKFAEELITLLEKRPSNNEHLKRLSDLAVESFSLSEIARRTQQIYESAYFLQNYSNWIPVLMYHKIPDQEIQSQHKIYVTKSNFEKHLQFFKKRGFQTLTFSDLKKFRSGQKNFSEFPKKPLLLTFDDGYRDNLENASPLLKQYDFTAQIFLLADPNINSNNWDQSTDEPSHEIISGPERQKWKDSAFEIGSHGFSHEKISSLNSEQACAELTDSKKALEKEFSQPVNVFAFTYGITIENSRQLAENAGYDYAVRTDSGGNLIEEDPFAIFRVNIFPDENFWSLLKKTSGWYRRYYKFKRKK